MFGSASLKIAWRNKLLISLVCGCLLSLVYLSTLFILFCFIVFAAMLLLLQEELSSLKRFYGLTFGFCISWNASSIWWLWNASPVGCVATILANSVVLTFPWLVYFILQNIAKKKLLSLSGWLCGFLAMEYFHHNWELHFPWLCIGNLLAHTPSLLQWISITGIAGIALWVLVVNLGVFLVITYPPRYARLIVILTSSIFLVPIIVSLSSLIINKKSDTYCQQKESIYAVIVQPNIESYVEKFTIPAHEQIDTFLSLSSVGINRLDRANHAHPVIVVWPETGITQPLFEREIQKNNPLLAPIFKWIKDNKVNMLVTGAVTVEEVEGEHQFANTALHLTSDGLINHHVKTKLVPGAETTPYQDIFPVFESLSVDLGGISGSLVSQGESTVFADDNSSTMLAPIICYESVFGSYVSSYVRHNANILCIITNDGWWGNTPGHIQHLNIARLRAVENRRYILRSANTGVSCYITHQGIINNELTWNQKGVISACVPLKKEKTIYVRYGDYLYQWSYVLLATIGLVAVYLKIKKQMFRKV